MIGTFDDVLNMAGIVHMPNSPIVLVIDYVCQGTDPDMNTFVLRQTVARRRVGSGTDDRDIRRRIATLLFQETMQHVDITLEVNTDIIVGDTLEVNTVVNTVGE